MGFLSGLVQGGLDLMHDYDPINSALLNGMIDVDTTGVRETMNSSEHFWDDQEKKYAPGFLQGIAGGLKNNSQHWSEMAQKDNDNHARAITNAGLTLASLYGAYYGAANPGTTGGSFGSGYAAGSGTAAASGADQDSIAKAGVIGGAAGASGQYVGAETGSPALGGATQGAVGAGLNGGNIGRGAITGGLSAGMPDVGTTVGIDNPELNKTFNNTLKAGLVARANGGDVRSNMLGAGVTGLAGYGASLMDNNEYGSGYDPIKASAGSYSSPAPWASNLGGGAPSTPTPWSMQGGGYTPTESGAQPAGNPVKDMFKQGLDYGRDVLGGVSDFTGINRSNFGNVAEGLAGLYQGYQQRKQARDLQTMMGMRRQAYQDQLRKNLMARDAAAGKRSDYGGRETQLMSSLAELDARNAPAMMGLSNMQLGGGLGMLQSGLRLGGKMGWLDTGTQPNLSPMQMPTLATLPYIRPSYNTLDTTSNDPMNWDRMRRPDQFGQ